MGGIDNLGIETKIEEREDFVNFKVKPLFVTFPKK